MKKITIAILLLLITIQASFAIELRAGLGGSFSMEMTKIRTEIPSLADTIEYSAVSFGFHGFLMRSMRN
ncbi:hypothetical protein K7I13_09995 [Brucepastera parasyntrophica]|uniref:hypothetical protein n=1 Tax=Brucepastera parasyntrophica TaxID=2880008 RepID=UPI0021092E5D|nr:hypothetical protein [Brucepastera parasyntrophica]ULQ58859.1 hypothetical protein K7I13_09995 [Brucepastera parasyntrophica]